MTLQDLKIEYNTEALGGTFDRLCGLGKSPPRDDRSSINVPANELEDMVVKSFTRLHNTMVEDLAIRAADRLMISGRVQVPDTAALICEVVTDKSIRKGSLSTAGRNTRAAAIREKLKLNECVTFAILMLPFRTASPAKNVGLLPDIGEMYSLLSLHAIAAACEKAQQIVSGRVNVIFEEAGIALKSSIATTSKENSTDLKPIFDDILEGIDASEVPPKNKVILKKRLRRMIAEKCALTVSSSQAFRDLVLALLERDIPLSVCMEFSREVITPVQIVACQDAGRYPCFSDVCKKQIAVYRQTLLGMITALGLSDKNLRLVAYEEFCAQPQESRIKDWYQMRCDELERKILAGKPEIIASKSRSDFQSSLSSLGLAASIVPLFEPILLSLEYPDLVDDGAQSYVRAVTGVYTPSLDKKAEEKRQDMMMRALQGAIQYCAAYEANTGSKNPSGFDDVASVFPDALRMSIHQKDEDLGHFSVHVSPTANRTPWHGTATLNPGFRSTRIKMDIDLAIQLEDQEDIAVVAQGSMPSCFALHAGSGQPVFYVSRHLGPRSAGELRNLFAQSSLTPNG